MLAVGIGLVWAARDPVKYRAVIGVGFLAALFHTLNHVYDDVLVDASLSKILQGSVLVGLETALLGLAWFLAGRKKR